MKNSQSQVYSIQGLRGLAALAVVIAHSLEHGKLGGVPALFTGRFGVEIFFVISGFVITLASGNGRFSPSNFAIRRFMRVVPLYWITTLLVAGLAIVLPSMFKNTTFDILYFIKSLAFVPDPLPGTNDWRPLFKLGWTLNYEMFFYAIVCTLFWCRTGLIRSVCLISIMIVLIFGSFGVEIRSGIPAFYLNLNLMPFAAGVVICEAFRQRPTLMEGVSPYFPFLVVVAIGSIYWALQYSHEEYRALPGHLALTSAAVSVVLTALSAERFFKRSGALWSWLGNISYSLYLLHMFIVGAGWAIIRRMAHGQSEAIITSSGILAIIIISLVAATISYKLFEVPLAKIAKAVTGKSGRFSAKAPVIAPAA
ncbi:acyltransferase family protein [Sphingomonas sp. Leaf20]|uniref:acyltransferase family protein n=1 Tax=Sphingomonas sp. Leaf20 TaxID=1735685 RepID=UPI0009EA01BC|nr:acyltransferase [Sphingomonas sp. Leaf20]